MVSPVVELPADDERDAAPVVRAWTADGCFVGALLWSPLDRAASVLDVLTDSDLTEPPARLVADLARELVASGRAPDPQAILSRGIESGRAASEHGARRLMAFLADVYHDVPDRAGVCFYAADVLAARYRSSFAELAAQLDELDATGSLDELEHALATGLERMSNLHRRHKRVCALAGLNDGRGDGGKDAQ